MNSTAANSVSGQELATPPSPPSIIVFLALEKRARAAADAAELAFLLVNDSRQLVAYRQAVLWFSDGGTKALSGVMDVEANAPYTQWLDRLARNFLAPVSQPQAFKADDIPEEAAAEWGEWLPEHALWLPLAAQEIRDGITHGGLLLAREEPWGEDEILLLGEWLGAWRHAYHALARPPLLSLKRWLALARDWLARRPDLPWWQSRRIRVAAAVAGILLFPVRLSVLAQGELVPANPAAIRAPLDGVVSQFHVRPNESVKAGQPLLSFDEAPITSRLEVAEQALSTAQAEYRQSANQALSDNKVKGQLAILTGKIEEKRAEAEFLRDQLNRARFVAPQDGVAIFDDPAEWIGRPVQTGERIMRIADPGDVEVEAWLPIGDAIPLPPGAAVQLYLSASPFSSVSARVRYVSQEAVARPDASYAYRVRASLDEESSHRAGLKGTAKLSGNRVPLIYWVIRRPLAAVRQTLGI